MRILLLLGGTVALVLNTAFPVFNVARGSVAFSLISAAGVSLAFWQLQIVRKLPS